MPLSPGSSSATAPLQDRDLAAWHRELGLLAAGVAHEINNFLNGASVNLEVVRSRASRNAESSVVSPFADAASGQLELLTPVIRSLVALTRQPAEPVSLAAELHHVTTVCHAIAAARGGAVLLEPEVSEAAPCVSGATARLLLASAVRHAAESGGRIRCSTVRDELSGDTVVRIAGIPDGLTLAPHILDAAGGAAVGVGRDTDALVLAFPASDFPPAASQSPSPQPGLT